MAESHLTPAARKHREEFASFSIKHGHEAFRAILESLYGLWDGWNRDYFAGVLIRPHILLAEPKSPRALGDHANISGWGSRNQIRIRPSVLDGSHPQVRAGDEYAQGRFLIVADILLHETIHQYHDEVTGKNEKSYHGHGPAFRDECNRIGQELGLSQVRTAKARGPEKELPSCAHWPFNVRPEGYYLGAFEPGAEATTEQGEETGEEEADEEKRVAGAEKLATFLAAAIDQFEEQFIITADEKLQALHQVVEGIKPGKGTGRRRAGK